MGLNIVVHGASGRMGKELLEIIAADESLSCVAMLGQEGTSCGAHGVARSTLSWDGRGDVVVDFSSPDGLGELLAKCEEFKVPLVSGTTGLSEAQRTRFEQAGSVVPVLYASNFSVGLLVLARALEMVAASLPAGYDCEIVEAHHRHKVDAPSGTALDLAQRVATARGVDLNENAVWGRQGRTGERPPGEIGVHAVRMGDIVGHHDISFSGVGETLSLRHEARNRGVFLAGAVLAARFAAAAKPGSYQLKDAVEWSTGAKG